MLLRTLLEYTLSVSKDTNCVASRDFVFLGYGVAPDRLTCGENWTLSSRQTLTCRNAYVVTEKVECGGYCLPPIIR